MTYPAASHEGAVLRTVRALLLGVLGIGMVGTAIDLLLLEHYEDAWQIVPLAMTALGLVVVAWVWVNGGANAITTLRITMVLFVATGAAGLLLHYSGNSEFQQEIDPALEGWALFLRVIRAKAPPALAPAVMIHMGLLGLLYTYRHRAIERASPHDQN